LSKQLLVHLASCRSAQLCPRSGGFRVLRCNPGVAGPPAPFCAWAAPGTRNRGLPASRRRRAQASGVAVASDRNATPGGGAASAHMPILKQKAPVPAPSRDPRASGHFWSLQLQNKLKSGPPDQVPLAVPVTPDEARAGAYSAPAPAPAAVAGPATRSVLGYPWPRYRPLSGALRLPLSATGSASGLQVTSG
jgi:hypothetical protein